MSYRKVALYIAMSLDGYIAKDEDNIDFLSVVETCGEDYGYAAFQQTVGTLYKVVQRQTTRAGVEINPKCNISIRAGAALV